MTQMLFLRSIAPFVSIYGTLALVALAAVAVGLLNAIRLELKAARSV